MQTHRATIRRNRPIHLATLTLLVAAIAACSGGQAPSSTAAVSQPPDATSSAVDLPAPVDPNESGAGAVLPDGRRLVVPQPGQLEPRPISAEALTADVDDRRVVITIDYSSGVEPCSVLDTIVVARGQGSFAITLNEGHGPGDVACIAIAEAKRAVVDLGELEAGTYEITDGTGGAAPISVTVE